jgi:preprotein translocase subunit SecD
MTDELERRLRDAFREAPSPPAPRALVAALERVPDVPFAERRRSGRRPSPLWGAFGLAAVLALGGALALSIGQRGATPVPSGGPVSPSGPTGSAGPGIVLEFAPTNGVAPTAEEVAAVIEVVRRRIEAAGYGTVAVTRTGESRIVVEVASGLDRDSVRRLAAQTGRVDFIALGERAAEAGDIIDDEGRSSLFTGAAVASATVEDDPGLGRVLDLALEPAAARILADYTSANVGSYLAITLDGRVVAAPLIQSSIPDGRIRIASGTEGGFSDEEVRDLVAILTSGPLPVPLR